MTSTCSISRLLMRAWAPVSFMVPSSDDSGHEKPLAAARGEVALGARGRAGRYVTTTTRWEANIERILTPDRGGGCKAVADRYSSSVLMQRAPVGRAAANLGAPKHRTVARTRAVERAGHVTGVRAAPAIERPQHRADRLVQHTPLIGVDGRGGPDGIDARAPQHFVGEQIAETGNAVLIHEHGLDRRGPQIERPVELGERKGHRIGPEAALVGVELDGTEPARVTHHEVAAVGEADTEAVPARHAPIARVDQRIACFLVVDEHATTHP